MNLEDYFQRKLKNITKNLSKAYEPANEQSKNKTFILTIEFVSINI